MDLSDFAVAVVITPRACARGKVIGHGVVVVIQKIDTSQVLGI
jgi:hypothetical protein